ncbi:MAG: hypothetical protein GY754_40560 [bacterium]|nr:hypothetical protein [bacterium]
MTFKERLRACLICGAIGDAIGSRYEGTNLSGQIDHNFNWTISDDTQLTLATAEAIYNADNISPEKIAERFVHWFNRGKLTGLGSATLKALRELQLGGHWALVGRTGEYAAGNGAAMRIAPLAFKNNVDKRTIKDTCSITHKNDEAYSGALAIYHAVLFAINGTWTGENNLMDMVINKLPDTRVKDRMIEIMELNVRTISEIGQKCKPSGFVVDSVPVSIFAAQKINHQDFKSIIEELISIGGDTDTTCSMTGNILGALKGPGIIPEDWLEKYNTLGINDLIDKIVQNWT